MTRSWRPGCLPCGHPGDTVRGRRAGESGDSGWPALLSGLRSVRVSLGTLRERRQAAKWGRTDCSQHPSPPRGWAGLREAEAREPALALQSPLLPKGWAADSGGGKAGVPESRGARPQTPEPAGNGGQGRMTHFPAAGPSLPFPRLACLLISLLGPEPPKLALSVAWHLRSRRNAGPLPPPLHWGCLGAGTCSRCSHTGHSAGLGVRGVGI